MSVVYEKPGFLEKLGFYKKFLYHTKAEKRYKLLVCFVAFEFFSEPLKKTQAKMLEPSIFLYCWGPLLLLRPTK